MEIIKEIVICKADINEGITKESLCPRCESEVHKVYIEDVYMGEWCLKCNVSIKKLKGEFV
jgi:hypothetical protein